MINLTKGQKVDLTKTNSGLSEIIVGLGWDTNKYDGGSDFDLDSSVFMLNPNGKCNSESDFIYYGNTKGTGVLHTGDNLTGEGEGDDEQLIVNLKEVKEDVAKILFTTTIYQADERSQNFGQVSNAYIRIVNKETNEEILRYDLGEDYSIETGVVFGEVYRHNGEWKFNAVGNGFQGGLQSMTKEYL